jgi:L-lactate dehydrogenase (cytochrome)
MPLLADRPLGLAPGSISDYRELARRRLPRQLFDYIDGGAYDEATMRANVEDLAGIALRQRVMRDVSDLDLRVTVLGQDLAMPVALGPVGLGGMFARRAEVQAAQAAEAAGVPFCESTVSICGIEEVASNTSAPFWYQLYVMRDRSYAEELMARAKAAGCPVLVLTVDLPVVGARYRDNRNGMVGEMPLPKRLRQAVDFAMHPKWVRDVAIGGKPHTFGNLEQVVPGGRNPRSFKEWVDSQFDPSVTWDDLAWVREHWDGPILLKGVLDAEDARRAVDAGVQGVVVSNHGGRQLDATPSTITALPDVVRAVDGRIDVLFDGGIRSGLDVVKAMALGANACLIGRAWAYAVAARGRVGVAHVLDIIRADMQVALALTGVPKATDLDASALVDGPLTRS